MSDYDNLEAQLDRWGRVAEAARRLSERERDICRRLSDFAHEAPDEAEDGPAAWAALSARERRHVHTAVCPRLSDALERGYELIGQGPYSVSGYRGSSRAAGRPDLFVEQRWRWLCTVAAYGVAYDADALLIARWAEEFKCEWPMGLLLAAFIDLGGRVGRQVFALLADRVRAPRQAGGLPRAALRALFTCNRPDGWALVAEALVAGARDEGDRDWLLGCLEEGHPLAFALLLKTVLEHDLLRFKGVRQRVDGWLQRCDADLPQAEAEASLRRLVRFLTDRRALESALAGDDAVALYEALWVQVYLDAPRGMARAEALLGASRADQRLAAVMALRWARLPECVRLLVPALADDDLHVAMAAAQFITLGADDDFGRAYHRLGGQDRLDLAGPDLFEHLLPLAERLPSEAAVLPAMVYPSWTIKVAKSDVTPALLLVRGERPVEALVAVAGSLDGAAVSRLAGAIGPQEAARPAVRAWLVSLLDGRSHGLRVVALRALRPAPLSEGEVARVEALLGGSVSQVREAALELLGGQPDGAALASAKRLLAGSARHRLGGLALLGALHSAGRCVAGCLAEARDYRAAHAQLDADERAALAWSGEGPVTRDDGPPYFGLVDEARLAPPWPPRDLSTTMATPAALALLEDLLALLRSMADLPMTRRTDRGEESYRLADAHTRWLVPGALAPAERTADRMPFMDAWLDWNERRPSATRDADGLELVRALWLRHAPRRSTSPGDADWLHAWNAALTDGAAVPADGPAQWLEPILWWLLLLTQPAPSHAADLLLDACETSLARLPSDARHATRGDLGAPVRLLALHYLLCPSGWDGPRLARAYRLGLWLHEPAADAERGDWRARVPFGLLVGASERGGIQPDDLLRYTFGWLPEPLWRRPDGASMLEETGTRWYFESPGWLVAREAVVSRLLEIELERGDQPTAAADLLGAAVPLVGVDKAAALLRALASGPARGPRATALGELLRGTAPADGETPEQCAERLRDTGLSQQALCEAAVSAPQWADALELVLGWPGLAEAVAWRWAHDEASKRGRGSSGAFEGWSRLAILTDLPEADRRDGMVDVAWLGRVRARLGDKPFDAFRRAVRGEPARGTLDALLGATHREALLALIADKRRADALCRLALLPLPDGDERADELQARYAEIVAFERSARASRPQRRQSELRAAECALANLARNAGYDDAERLRWRLEGEALDDLADGGVRAVVDGVTVELAIGPDGQPELRANRAGRPLAKPPAAVAKQPEVAALIERRGTLVAASGRVRASLEAAMCRGDEFTGGELAHLLGNPLLAPMLGALLWSSDEGLGYLVERGLALGGLDGRIRPLGSTEPLRLAHPVDLLASGEWDRWQRDCFTARRRQPFRQVFRELYTLIEAEREDCFDSRRYAGCELQPRQALGILAGHGWLRDHRGGHRRTWHRLGVAAVVTFEEPFVVLAQLSSLTVATCHFTRSGDWRKLPLAEVPPRLFSEAMRDLDLMVTVAHRGEQRPPSSLSTVAQRAALVRETCALMELRNVVVEADRVLIRGRHADYRVHLDTAQAYCEPDHRLPLEPVADRGAPLWLPFADDDPRAAEVLAKVLLLARDAEASDQALLRRLRGLPPD